MNWLVLALFIVGCELVGVLGAFFVSRSVDEWYTKLKKPSWTPPRQVFGPVWIVLYAVMGVAAYLVWEEGASLWLFYFQLLLNFLWTFFFFGLRSPRLALVDILLLWLALIGTAVAFLQVDWKAGALMMPYVAWITYAGLLNLSILETNAPKENKIR